MKIENKRDQNNFAHIMGMKISPRLLSLENRWSQNQAFTKLKKMLRGVTFMYRDSFMLQPSTRGSNCWILPAGKHQYKDVRLDIHKGGISYEYSHMK